MSLVAALEAGRELGAMLPDEISIVTIEARNVTEFSESLTHEVEAAIPIATARVLRLLGDA